MTLCFTTVGKGVWRATEQRKQLSVVTDGSEGVLSPDDCALQPNNRVGEGRHTMRVHSHATDESSLGNKAPNPNNSATRGYCLTAFSVRLLPRPLAQGRTSLGGRCGLKVLLRHHSAWSARCQE